MQILRKWRLKKAWHQELKAGLLPVHDRLAQESLDLAASGDLQLPDDFNVRFEVMLLLISRVLWLLKSVDGPDSPRVQTLWDLTFEGFDQSLRSRGVTDMGMSRRMRKLLGHATGRRNAYIAALEKADRTALMEAISRNCLNGASPEDARVALLLDHLEKIPALLAETGLSLEQPCLPFPGKTG
ncbi:MAG: hypothetical protein HQL56_06260 [Magnetococcales bacterium]|nr:hypothetical protein [Magnetococcales bacterium]